jgi:hypothetical protein
MAKNSNGGKWTLASTALVAMLAFGVTGCGTASGAAPTDQMSAASIARSALNNAYDGGWVHEIVHTEATGQSLSMVNDIGTSDGRQVVDANGAEATVIVLGPAAYIQGDVDAINNYFALSIADPQQVAGKWLSLEPSDPNYSAVTAAVTLRTDFSSLIEGPFTKGQVTTVAGQQAIPLFGHSPAEPGNPSMPVTIYVTATGKVLPIEFHASYQGTTETASWSAWGRTVSLVAPPNPIPESSVDNQPSSPPGTSNV